MRVLLEISSEITPYNLFSSSSQINFVFEPSLFPIEHPSIKCQHMCVIVNLTLLKKLAMTSVLFQLQCSNTTERLWHPGFTLVIYLV